MNRTELLEKLTRIDEDAWFAGVGRDGKKVRVVIIGGSALLLRNLLGKQATKDVDIYEAEKSVSGILFSDPDFNAQCQAYVGNIPFNFESRLESIELQTRAIDFCTPSVEDLAVMKLYRWEAPDKADLTSERFTHNLNWELLDQLVHNPEEAAASRISTPETDREFKMMLLAYDEYKRNWMK